MATVALVAAIVGGLAGGGLVAATDGDGAPSATTVPGVGAISARPTSIRAVLAKVQPAVVSIKTEAFSLDPFSQPASGAGTGMILTPDGEVLTNHHVVEGATTIVVTLDGETEGRPADLVGSDPSADVALLKIRNASGLPTVALGASADVQVGDEVIAIGNALGLPGGPSVTVGIVSAKDRSLVGAGSELTNLVQTDAAINPGNSGGPLVNLAAQVVGMNTAVLRGNNAESIGFAIAVDTVKPILTTLRTGRGAVRSTAFLGVTSQTLTADMRARFDFTPTEGAVVVAVAPGSPAAAAGLDRGDVIVEFGGTAIATADELVAEVRRHNPGEKVVIEWFTASSRNSRAVELGSRPIGDQ